MRFGSTFSFQNISAKGIAPVLPLIRKIIHGNCWKNKVAYALSELFLHKGKPLG